MKILYEYAVHQFEKIALYFDKAYVFRVIVSYLSFFLTYSSHEARSSEFSPVLVWSLFMYPSVEHCSCTQCSVLVILSCTWRSVMSCWHWVGCHFPLVVGRGSKVVYFIWFWEVGACRVVYTVVIKCVRWKLGLYCSQCSMGRGIPDC